MSITIRVPNSLRQLAGGAAILQVEGATVGAAVASVQKSYPDLGARLLDDNGDVHRFINLFANDEDIRFLDDLQTKLADGDEISVVPAVAGGS
jgi:molybdopterin synthase sulfur carrier subunit